MTILRAPFKTPAASPKSAAVKQCVDMRAVGTIILGGGSGKHACSLSL